MDGAKCLAILENVSFAVIPQPPYASTTRHLRSDQHLINELLRGCITLMSNAADRDSLVLKCQLGVICLWLDQYHNLAPKEEIGGHDGKSQQYNHVCSCVVSPHPRHGDKLKNGVPGGRAG